MKKHFLTSLSKFLNDHNVWSDRFEQIQMEVEYNLEKYPACHNHYRKYKALREQFENAHPELTHELDALLSLVFCYFTDLGVEAYKQGAADLFQAMKQIDRMGERHSDHHSEK